MSKYPRVVVQTILAASVFASACSEPVAPTTDDVRAGQSAQDLLGAVTQLIAPVQRTTPLASDVTWTFVAGPNGGMTYNQALGVSVVVPAGALSSTVTFTVTALAGSNVAYSFSPHTVFNRSVYLTQDLRGTTVGFLTLPLLSGAHFPNALELTPSGLAKVDEIVPALVLPWTRTVTIGVGHFTGWIIATGREGASEE